MEDVLFVLPAELHTFMLVHIGYRRSIRHHFGTIAFKNRIQYANDWSQKISVHIPMRKTAIRVKAKRTRWNTWFQRVGGDGEIRTLAGFYTPTAFRVISPLWFLVEIKRRWKYTTEAQKLRYTADFGFRFSFLFEPTGLSEFFPFLPRIMTGG